MRTMGGDQVEEAVAGAVALLRPVTGEDWGVRAGRLEWTCRRTAEHIASELIGYAGQLAGRATEAYLPFGIALADGTGNDDVLDVVEAAGALLAAAVRTTPREVRAYHPAPFRSAGREGFAAMGVTEALLHTHDIAVGLGLAYTPPERLCEDVLTHIFPQVRPGPGHWRTLLWATGRGDLPGRPSADGWRWHNNLVIRAERLTLQGVTPAAAADLHTGGTGGFDWLGGAPYEGTQFAAGMLLKAYETGVHRPEFGMFALVREEDGRAVGGMGFHGAPDEEGRAEVGYDLVEEARGNGYATEALRALSDRALARDDVRTLFATVDRDNLPSQGVLSRAGFHRLAEEDDEVRQYAYERHR
ncbi:GNAT family N-acetyltransferase [Streptomyces minutiscleroticus]|uniref:Acetyltransferase n=1 Tax=Streptomyces minutiscleroticus TaxID=68238 RepID=A0A918KJM7_9ACTN|nr:GNAT family N-acetyltransferase [Streptomyces minutiscleroticus]GGX63470.1 acetyltransferase [Streptomyces minutiscleroticus]